MYDFDTVHSRVGVNSAKWHAALEAGAPADIVPLTVADMEFKSAPVITQALREVAECGLWGYTYASDDFRDSIAGWMEKRHSWRPEREWMVHTSGVVPALYAAVRAYTAPGDGILVQPPVYPPFYSAAKGTGRHIVENPLKKEGNRYEIDFDDLERKLPQANLMIFCSPHNPVGRVWSREEVEKVAEMCLRHGVPLFSDEIHCDLILPGHEHFSVGRLSGERLANALVGTSASKTFSLAGLACSTVMVPGYDLRKQLEDELEACGYDFNNTFGTVATQTAYHGAEDWLDELLAYLQKNIRYMEDFLRNELPSLSMSPPEGTYLAWVDFTALRMGGDELQDFLHNEAKLYINDGRMFGNSGNGFGRVNLACPQSVLQSSLERLRQAVKKLGV